MINGLLVYCALTPQQQPGSCQDGDDYDEMFHWWRTPEYPEETTDIRQVNEGYRRKLRFCLKFFVSIVGTFSFL